VHRSLETFRVTSLKSYWGLSATGIQLPPLIGTRPHPHSIIIIIMLCMYIGTSIKIIMDSLIGK